VIYPPAAIRAGVRLPVLAAGSARRRKTSTSAPTRRRGGRVPIIGRGSGRALAPTGLGAEAPLQARHSAGTSSALATATRSPARAVETISSALGRGHHTRLQRPSVAAPEKGSAVRVHRTMGSAAQVGSTTKVRGSALGAFRPQTTRAAANMTTVRTARGTTVRTAGGTTVASGGHWVWHGGRQVWVNYGFTGGGYSYGPVATGAVYGGTYGIAGRSCWWYRHYDPADLPRWCPRYYGSSYGYSYGYSAPSYR